MWACQPGSETVSPSVPGLAARSLRAPMVPNGHSPHSPFAAGGGQPTDRCPLRTKNGEPYPSDPQSAGPTARSPASRPAGPTASDQPTAGTLPADLPTQDRGPYPSDRKPRTAGPTASGQKPSRSPRGRGLSRLGLAPWRLPDALGTVRTHRRPSRPGGAPATPGSHDGANSRRAGDNNDDPNRLAPALPARQGGGQARSRLLSPSNPIPPTRLRSA